MQSSLTLFSHGRAIRQLITSHCFPVVVAENANKEPLRTAVSSCIGHCVAWWKALVPHLETGLRSTSLIRLVDLTVSQVDAFGESVKEKSADSLADRKALSALFAGFRSTSPSGIVHGDDKLLCRFLVWASQHMPPELFPHAANWLEALKRLEKDARSLQEGPLGGCRKSPGCRPFVIVLQSAWQREVLSGWLSAPSVAHLDATFKTNYAGWGLFSLVALAGDRVGVPVGYALFSFCGVDSVALSHSFGCADTCCLIGAIQPVLESSWRKCSRRTECGSQGI